MSIREASMINSKSVEVIYYVSSTGYLDKLYELILATYLFILNCGYALLVMFQYGRLHESKGNWREAKQCYDDVLAGNHDHFDTLLHLVSFDMDY